MIKTTTETKITATASSSSNNQDNSKKPPIKQGAQNISQGFPTPFPVPTSFASVYHHRKWMLEHMAGAFRVFARKGYNEGGAGHISLRDPEDPNTFWINPLNIHFGLLKASDMVRVDEEGNVIGGNQVAVNAAGFKIHSALHKARPDVNAACHTHSIYGKAWSCFGKPVEMLNQDSCTFHGCQAVYTDFGGVVLESEEGEKIAEALGEQNKVVILQNHGLLTTGETIDEAAYRFTLLENTCHAQLLADSNLNFKKNFIADEQAAYTREMVGDSETLYGDFQNDYLMEVKLCNGDFLFPEDYDLETIK
ncbi:hypothetical protein DASC09_056240 [Saccharomycopsis crataegensis]|uniref:Class II aldolase/adducin N-terminal domain-containing protein n=1 Tax=Saccharomycopsis crataegensis TaxID=43959 RepID=A0AAV5QVS0_9ASCO|nr:hypothetical protein DASC09_056240 [Saccharomycopsis crataegensis]